MRTLAAVILTFVSFSPAHAQITAVADDTRTPVQGVGHDFIKMLSETVDPSNGSVSIRINTPTAPGRGFTLPFSFDYNSNGIWHLDSDPVNYGKAVWRVDNTPNASGGWTFALPWINDSQWTTTNESVGGQFWICQYTGNYVFREPGGSRHQLNLGSLVEADFSGAAPNSCNPNGEYYTGGDLQIRASLACGNNCLNTLPPLSVYDAEGTLYYYPSIGTMSTNNVFYGLPSYIEDRNGNRINVTQSNGTTFTDTLGRTLLSSSNSTPGQVTVSGLTYLTTSTTTSASYQVPYYAVGNTSQHNCTPPPAVSGSPGATSTLTLPNGSQYQFYYGTNPDPTYNNPYGLISEIDYPSGAWVKYKWKPSDNYSQLASYTGVSNSFPLANGCEYQYAAPVVATRVAGFGGSSTPAQTQSFTYGTTWASGGVTWTQKDTWVTTTDNIRGKSALTHYVYSGIPGGVPPYTFNNVITAGQIPVEQNVYFYDWGNTSGAPPALRTATKTWVDPFHMTSNQTTLETGVSSKNVYSYVATSGFFEPSRLDEYDYGATSPTRSTLTTYQSFTGTPGYIVDKPCQVIVQDGSGTKFSEKDYLYDGGSTICGAPGSSATTDVSGLPANTHDDTLFAYNSSTPRGNLTKTSRWLNGGTSPSIAYSYDKTGHVLSMTDPCGSATCADMTGNGHTTTFSYADHYTVLSGGQNTPYTPSGNTNAYLTQITNPLGQSLNFTYDFNNGQLTSSKDQNAQTTTYLYNDALARPTLFTNPDTGLSSFAYNDSAYNSTNNTPNVTATTAITGSLNKVSTTATDGVGHVVRTLLTSDPDLTDTVDTAYDGTGRVYAQSNPHRAASSSTDGTSTTNYDALGRVTSVLQADGSTTTTSYSGQCTTVTDEAGKSRKSCSDGLGRLVQIFEDPANLNYETDYTYDTLDNLLNVSQKGSAPTNSSLWRIRSFTYDSLSRLLTANNPESGTINYTYDANGNLSSKVAPQPNQTGTATVTTNYSYDVLNRLLGKSYVGMSTAPKYGYDGVAPSGCTPPTLADTYPIGRRTSMCDASGATSWAHDNMGRLITETRKIGTVTNTTRYSYNLDGSLASLTYPTGRVVSYTPGGAGQPLSAIDSIGPINYVSAAHYAPFGGLNSITNGASIKITDIYNKRLQPCWLYATTGTALSSSTLCTGTATTGTIQDIKYNFGLGTNDNGNVLQIVNNRDGNRTQNFLYDSLNRIAQAYTNGTNWGETFSPTATAPGVLPTTPGIDAWGNLTNRTSVTGKTNYELLNAAPATSSNRLPGFGYDAAGNMTSNGSATYTYDAENRITSTAGCAFTYDGDGSRVQKSGCGSTIYYWRDLGGNPLEESATGTLLREYVFFNGKRVARRDVATNNVHYFLSDHLGSTSLVTDAVGTMPPQSESDYFPYGGEIVVSSPTIGDQNYRFTGKERDAQSGLDNFGARYDSSALGRFMTPDWAAKPTTVPYANFGNPQSLNLYAYVENNPTTMGDPDGHGWIDPEAMSEAESDVAVGVGKGLYNMAAGTWNMGAQLLNDQMAATSQTHIELPLLPTAEPSNVTQAVSGGVAQLVAVVAGGVEGAARGAGVEAGEAAAAIPKEGVYEGPDATAPGRTYVGQSGDIPNRLAQHEASGKFPSGTKVTTTGVQGGKAAREVTEHNRIQQLGGVRSKPGSQTSNIRNPIGKNRQHLLKQEPND